MCMCSFSTQTSNNHAQDCDNGDCCAMLVWETIPATYYCMYIFKLFCVIETNFIGDIESKSILKQVFRLQEEVRRGKGHIILFMNDVQL